LPPNHPHPHLKERLLKSRQEEKRATSKLIESNRASTDLASTVLGNKMSTGISTSKLNIKDKFRGKLHSSAGHQQLTEKKNLGAEMRLEEDSEA